MTSERDFELLGRISYTGVETRGVRIVIFGFEANTKRITILFESKRIEYLAISNKKTEIYNFASMIQ